MVFAKGVLCTLLVLAATGVPGASSSADVANAVAAAGGSDFLRKAAGAAPHSHVAAQAALEFEAKVEDDLAQFSHLRAHHNHTDHYRDTFPLSMTPEMHKRVLKLRNLLRAQDNDLKELRGDRLARNDLKLRECRKKDIPGPRGTDIVPWKFKHQVVGVVFTDGLGHSLSTYLRQLYIASIYGCRSTLPNRYTVVRNYVFVPWDDVPVPNASAVAVGNSSANASPARALRRLGGHGKANQFIAKHGGAESGGGGEKKRKQQQRMSWLDREPTRFLYCHQLHETKTAYKKPGKRNDFITSEEFALNVNCYVFYVDPWRVLCSVALEGHCSTERDELRPNRAKHGDGNEEPDEAGGSAAGGDSRRQLSMDPKNIRRREKKAELAAAGGGDRDSDFGEDGVGEDEEEEEDDYDSEGDDASAGGIVHISAARWRKKGYPGYINLDKIINAKQRVSGLPGPTDNRTRTAVRRTLRRTQAHFWDAVQVARRRNMAVRRNREQLEALGVTPAQMEWDCGFEGAAAGGGGSEDGTLDVAIHMRRGDLYQSASQDDANRYFSMDYYHDLLGRLLKAWEGSPVLQAKYPRIRFHVHSESQDMPPPYGTALELPEFDGVTFIQPENFHIEHHRKNASLVCPVGKLHAEADPRLRMRFCLNINPLYSLFCMAKADVFVASESYFSTLVAVTSPAVKIVPLSASKTFFDRKLCNGMGLCALDDRRTISDQDVTAESLQAVLLETSEDGAAGAGE